MPMHYPGDRVDGAEVKNVWTIDFVTLEPYSRWSKAEIARATEAYPELSQYVRSRYANR